MWKRLGTLTLAAALFMSLMGPAANAASTNNVLLPNGCQIDGSLTYNSVTYVIKAKTHEDFGCELMQAKIRFYDTNNSKWVTHASAWDEGDRYKNVYLTKYSDREPLWSDHNGIANGSNWGFRVYY